MYNDNIFRIYVIDGMPVKYNTGMSALQSQRRNADMPTKK